MPAGEAGVWTDCFCSRDGVCWEHPRPTGADLEAVSVVDEETAFIVGTSVLRHTHAGWQRLELAPREEGESRPWPFEEVVAFSEDDAWIVGERVLRWDGQRIVALDLEHKGWLVAGTRSDDVWLVGAADEIYHWDGTSLQPVEPLPAEAGTPAAIAALGSSVWVVSREELFERGAQGWSAHPLPLSAFPHALWACSEEEVWVPEGTSGRSFLRWRNHQWSRLPAPGRIETLWTAAAGTSCDDVTLFGLHGEVARWDGETAKLSAQLPFQLAGADATSSSNLWAVAMGGGVVRFDGERWVELSQGAGGVITASAAHEGRAVIASVDGLLEQRSGRWERVAPLERALPRAVDFASEDDGWRVGERGSAARWNGSAWVSFPTGALGTLVDVEARSPDEVWAVGTAGALRRFDGTSWVVINADPSLDFARVSAVEGGAWLALDTRHGHFLPGVMRATPMGAEEPPLEGLPAELRVVDVWGSTLDEAWVATDRGVYRFDGASWSLALSGWSFTAIHGAGTEVFAGRREGGVHVWNGQTWTEEVSGLPPIVGIDARGEAIAVVAKEGTVSLRIGGLWQVHAPTPGRQLEDVVSASLASPTELWLVSRQGYWTNYLGGPTEHDLFRWQSGDLRRALAVSAVGPIGLAFDDTGALWGVGAGGALARHDDTGWVAGPDLTLRNLTSVTRSFDGRLLATGQNGALVELVDGAWYPLPSADRHLRKAVRAAAGRTAVMATDGTVGTLDGGVWSWPSEPEFWNGDIEVSPDGATLWTVRQSSLRRCVGETCDEYELPSAFAWRLFADEELWLVGALQDLVRLDDEEIVQLAFEAPFANPLRPWRAADGTLYFAWETGGIARYYPPLDEAPER